MAIHIVTDGECNRELVIICNNMSHVIRRRQVQEAIWTRQTKGALNRD